MTRRTRGFIQQVIKELKPYIVGWRGYLVFCQTCASPHEPRSVDPSKIARKIFGGSGEPGKTASRSCAVAA